MFLTFKVKFMCGEKGFAEDRVRNGAKKLIKGRQGSTQGRLDSFFKVMPTTPNAANSKRKSDENKNGNSAKKAKSGAGAKKGCYKRWSFEYSTARISYVCSGSDELLLHHDSLTIQVLITSKTLLYFQKNYSYFLFFQTHNCIERCIYRTNKKPKNYCLSISITKEV